MTHAIPTTHLGVNFRSRLEARWAEMFNLLGWRWTYEPIDLDGYIPDFVLHLAVPVLVEVKPALNWRELEAETRKGKIHGDGRQILLVGGAPLSHGRMYSGCDLAAIGLLFDDLAWGPAPLRICDFCKLWGFLHEQNEWRSRTCGHNDGWGCGAPMADVDALWRQAGNRTQWRGLRTP